MLRRKIQQTKLDFYFVEDTFMSITKEYRIDLLSDILQVEKKASLKKCVNLCWSIEMNISSGVFVYY
jgi:hypothetical protein